MRTSTSTSTSTSTKRGGKVVDVYLPLDSRDEPNRRVWPIATRQLAELAKVIRRCGYEPNVLNPEKPVASVAEGLQVIRRARGDRFVAFFGGWAYPDFTVSPLWQLPRDVPKLLLGSAIPDFPGAVGLLAAASGTSHVGIETSRLFVERFDGHATYEGALATFLAEGRYEPPPAGDPVPIDVTDAHRAAAREVRDALRGRIYGAVGPRSMQMWNKISEADFLSTFGIAREGFDGLRLARMAEKVPDARAESALRFLVDHGLDLRLGTDPARSLTRDMVLFQMKVYFALLELKAQFGLDFVGVQDQLDWIEHYPATDLALGLLNNKLRPETDGATVVASTEADDGAAITMQVLKLLAGGEPVGFNDLRTFRAAPPLTPTLSPPRATSRAAAGSAGCSPPGGGPGASRGGRETENLYWFVNSGALAPFFAAGRHDSLAGAWSERQTYMYFKQGGGTSSVVVRIPGVVTWARFSYRNHKLYLCAGRGVTDVPTEPEWRARSERCSPDWPHWYLRLCGPVERHLNTNHPMTVCGDHLAELKALAQELGIAFECYDVKTPAEVG